MYSTIRFGTASKAAPQGRHLFRAGVGFEQVIKRLHLDSFRRTMSYVRRTTSYNTDVAHDVVRHARSTSYPDDVVRA